MHTYIHTKVLFLVYLFWNDHYYSYDTILSHASLVNYYNPLTSDGIGDYILCVFAIIQQFVVIWILLMIHFRFQKKEKLRTNFKKTSQIRENIPQSKIAQIIKPLLYLFMWLSSLAIVALYFASHWLPGIYMLVCGFVSVYMCLQCVCSAFVCVFVCVYIWVGF